MAIIKNLNMTNASLDVEKREPLHTVSGNSNKYKYYGK
jgi:hypothetical protein